MKIQALHQNWKMRCTSEKEWLPAIVPGSVYSDLTQNGKLDDPYWRDNENEALKLMNYDYEYELFFDPDDSILQSKRILLRFEGLDTVCEITLNGTSIGKTENMHRTFEFDVKALLKEKQNHLHITFLSPVRYIKEKNKIYHLGGSYEAIQGYPHLRKAHCMFGWDWGPKLPDTGIWRGVSLVGVSEARIDNVYITQKHTDNTVSLLMDVCTDPVSVSDISYSVILRTPDGKTLSFHDSPKEIIIENPSLWWPNGLGEQNLYTISVVLTKQGKELDRWEKRIGLRTLTMCTEKDSFGSAFACEVNGVRFFMMGANYIPEDNILSRTSPERTMILLKQCKAAHFNCIRVWGGGHYPSDAFYDCCDELGLVVWQDFMFTCAVYDLNEEFEENILAEFADNIKRLRHHPSLGLWCGNNEMEWHVGQNNFWVTDLRQKADYIKMFEYLIPKAVKKYDPNTFYWPASPSSGGSFDQPNDPNRGDVHFWEVWHGNKPLTEYRKHYFRFLSEFGFQSFPALKTIETFTLSEDRNIFSYVMEKHQRHNAANGKIMNYMGQTFLYPTGFDTLLYASQLLQAEAIKYGVEHFRRNRGRCMGAVYWQLNDCWPVASWSSIDYCGRWKALHYYAKRFFAPILLSCCEEGFLTQNSDVNAEPYELKKSIQLCVTNETLSEGTFTVEWELRNASSNILKESRQTITVEPLSAKWLEKVSLSEANPYTDYVSFRLIRDGEVLSCGSVLFGLPKHFHFEDPLLSYRVEGNELVIKAETYAKGVEIHNDNQDLLLSDNYFDMDAGERRVTILSGNPKGIVLRSVYDIR